MKEGNGKGQGLGMDLVKQKEVKQRDGLEVVMVKGMDGLVSKGKDG